MHGSFRTRIPRYFSLCDQHRPQIANNCTSTPNCMPPGTLPSILQKCAPLSPAPPAPRTAPCRQSEAASPKTPAKLHTQPPISQKNRPHRHQHLKQPWTSTPNCMPPSTRPSISEKCSRTVASTSNSTTSIVHRMHVAPCCQSRKNARAP